jgi:hypothetical protein
MNIASQIIAFENGDLDHDEVIDLFRHLLKTGLINHLQGTYQRTAEALIEEGLIDIH